jgi:hypothetical protein
MIIERQPRSARGPALASAPRLIGLADDAPLDAVIQRNPDRAMGQAQRLL